MSNKGWGNSVTWAKLRNRYRNQEYNPLILTMSSLLCSLRSTLSLDLILRKPDWAVLWFILLHFTFCCVSLLLLYSVITLMHCVPWNLWIEVHPCLWCYMVYIAASQTSGCYGKRISANVNKEFYRYHFGFWLIQCYHLCWLLICAFLWLWVIFSRWMQINFFKVTSVTVDRCMLLQTTLALQKSWQLRC